MNGAQLFAQCLVQQGVRYVFGIPGAKIDALFDALLDTTIKVILCHHEQNAAFMAAAVGRLTGKPGVALVTSGPGVSNLVTGLLTATTEGDPLIAIGGNVSRAMKLKESHQSTDNVKLTEAATKKSIEVVVPESIPEIVENAFRLASSPRSGAVFISLPQDVLKTSVDVALNPLMPPVEMGVGSQAEMAAKWIEQAKNPVLLLGQEASRLDNAKAIRSLLGKRKIATVSTFQAAGVISRELKSCFVGHVGLFRNEPGDELLNRADLVITVGYNPVEYDPEIWNAGKNAKKIVHIDYRFADIHSTYVPSLEVIGDIAKSIESLASFLEKSEEIKEKALVETLQSRLTQSTLNAPKTNGNKVHPLRFLKDLRDAIDDETTVVSDVGTNYMWLARYFPTYNPRHLLFSNGQQTLGVALPWAIATKLVRPDKKVVSVSGDGGFLFTATELETAVREKIALVHCVWCDQSYDMVREQQVMKYKRDATVHFGAVDHVKFAESFGAKGFRVNHPDEFLPLLKKAMEMDGPVILEIPIDYSDSDALFHPDIMPWENKLS